MYDGNHLSELLGSDEYTYIDDASAELATGLTSLGFIRGVLRRTRWVWRAIAVAGMLVGIVVAVKFPPAYQASTSILLTPQSSPGEASGGPILNEQAIAESRAVATLAAQKLGLKQSVSSFLASYTVTQVTDRLLVITVGAHSGSDAVLRARTLATVYLQFRANMAQTAQNLVLRSLDQQVAQAQQDLKALGAQISQVTAQPSSPAQRAKLKSLQNHQTQESNALTILEEGNDQTRVSTRITTTGVIQDSKVLDSASLIPPHSRLKRLIEYALLGLIAGLVLSMGIAIVGALISDRLRRRDDVARALDAPVEVGVGPVRLNRLRGARGLAAARNPNVRRIVSYLNSALPSVPRGPASLAVVAVDDVDVPAVCLAALAISCARRGLQVVVADLCDGAPAAKLLGVTGPGVQRAGVDGAQLAVIIPDPDDVVTIGPFDHQMGLMRAAEPVVSACTSADLLLTLARLDPSLGGEHLSGWARNAVAMVTAGQSSAARIHAVSEMVRLAGVPLTAGVLVGADKTDESLGVAVTPDGAGDDFTDDDLRSDANGYYLTADGAPGGRPADD